MKKLVTILMLFFAFNLHADFSFKLGGNITKFEKEDGLLDTYYQFGTTFFFSYKHNVYDNFFFDVNLGINKKVEDIKYVVEDIGYTKTRKTVAHYTLEAPIILGYGFNIDEYNKISLYTGAYFSVKFMNDDKINFLQGILVGILLILNMTMVFYWAWNMNMMDFYWISDLKKVLAN